MVAITRSKTVAAPRFQPKKRSSPKSHTKTPKHTADSAKSSSRLTSSVQSAQIRSTLNTFLNNLRENSTICPSQVARRMHDVQPAVYPDWRALMEPVRDVVWDEVERGGAEVTQGGIVRGLGERQGLKGPIRVRRGKAFGREEKTAVQDG